MVGIKKENQIWMIWDTHELDYKRRMDMFDAADNPD